MIKVEHTEASRKAEQRATAAALAVIIAPGLIVVAILVALMLLGIIH